VKKKYKASFKEKKEWIEFTKKMGTVTDKDQLYSKNNTNKNITKKIDLHGFSLEEANNAVKKFIINSYNLGHLKLLIVLGKGLRSKVYDDPYRSKDMNILKNSVPEYIKNNLELSDKILKISEADIKDGGQGAIYIFLKNNKKL
jgi:DNA-nicking Smr family endonuclease